MRRSIVMALALSPLLSGCHAVDASAPNSPRAEGRYAGVGVYEAGRLWGKMLGAPDPADPQLAKITDDEHVIVVVDTHTGEIRQCGDHSGWCVAISPWDAARPAPTMPAKLSGHGVEQPDRDRAVDAATTAN